MHHNKELREEDNAREREREREREGGREEPWPGTEINKERIPRRVVLVSVIK